jgi:hypothetical protein
MKFLKISAIVLMLLPVLAGCHNEPSSRFERRYQAFVNLLDGETLALFEAGSFTEAAVRFDARLGKEPELGARFLEVKEEENILFFSTIQVFRFFGETIRQRIAFHRALEKGEPAPEGYVADH